MNDLKINDGGTQIHEEQKFYSKRAKEGKNVFFT